MRTIPKSRDLFRDRVVRFKTSITGSSSGRITFEFWAFDFSKDERSMIAMGQDRPSSPSLIKRWHKFIGPAKAQSDTAYVRLADLERRLHGSRSSVSLTMGRTTALETRAQPHVHCS